MSYTASPERYSSMQYRRCAPEEVIENLEELDDDTEIYESIEDIWPDYPTKEDYYYGVDD